MIALTLIPSVSASCSRKAIWIGVNRLKDASSTTPSTWSSNMIGMMARLDGDASPRPEEILM